MPTTLNLRALRPDDALAVTSILAEMERREPVDEAYDEPEVIEELASPAIDLARGSVVVLDGDTLVAFGALSISAPAATWKASLWGGVHPDHTHRGIGRRVIDHLLDRAREIRAADNPGAPGELKIWAESNRPGPAVVGTQAGFDPWPVLPADAARPRRPGRATPRARGPVDPALPGRRGRGRTAGVQ